MDIGLLWSEISRNFPILSGNVAITYSDDDSHHQLCKDIISLGLSDALSEIVFSEIQSAVRDKIVPLFWSNFPIGLGITEQTAESQFLMFHQFASAVDNLQKNVSCLEIFIERVNKLHPRQNNDSRKLHAILLKTLLGQMPTGFNEVVSAFYCVAFQIYIQMYTNPTAVITDAELMMNKKECSGCKNEMNGCECQSLDILINKTNKALREMELLDGIAGESLTLLVQKCIKGHIKETCHGIFDRSFLRQLEIWLDETIINWLRKIFSHVCMHSQTPETCTSNIIKGFKVKLTYFLYEHFALSIIEQFFSIIIDFPDSIPAIDDLKICMEKIDMRKHFIRTLTNTLKVRVLHPGVNTMDILTGYIAAIKAIRYLDNSGIILETVTTPIRDYLRKRSDTVRRVVTGLTEEGPTDLTEELAKGESSKENAKLDANDELNNWENWLPDSYGIDQTARAQLINVNRSADIISMVVDIYGSKELFMNEYRNLMADRLLTYLDFNADKEIRNLELLKLRFGDSLLHSCEVMLKDLTDSKRINSHISSDTKYKENKTFDISAFTISAQFWPTFNKESLELPDEIANEFEKYTKAYEAYKGNRTLNWRTVTGRVHILIEIGQRIIEMTVSPTHAIILYHFQDKDEWLLEDLSQITKVPSTILRRRIEFWISHDLIKEIRPGAFKLVEDDGKKSPFEKTQLSQSLGEEDVESAMASASDQREEELQVFWSYIVGMLTNLDSLPLDRIHQMLKLFASHGGGIEFTQDELKNFLQRKVREHKLMYTGGVYQLYK
ncbi:anaphase-promoting complex subunit 2 [Bactrocera neohumeralis]|uniref:anaphase-promoting complex subunit 2 n=1 Tax=Bactrocera tryoni TaxID=59916 RepID=UPI001A97382A|nr:anaphase-promoting complex subunit 2 [Bactrocera tryoni]XP_050325646.1 anaphase-promoting complex subunit 2 [Bactrocera neohumeralis]